VVTTNLVIAETHALLLRRAGREPALAFAKTVRLPPNLIVWADAGLENQALSEWLERYDDQDFSFTDGVSFAVMQERRIEEALTLDQHFATAGFRMAPRA
jgi:predicted nucleic acid-binding protein